MEVTILSFNMKYKQFKDININDSFFDSLKEGYVEFENWFYRKADKYAYVMEDDNGLIIAFLYLKIEYERLDDIEPIREAKPRLKVGTFKINSHGSKLGERFVKKIFDYALANSISEIYVTVFEEHASLLKLLIRYGFIHQANKTTKNGTELVLFKYLNDLQEDVLLDYPLVSARNTNKYLLSIYPEYHTKLFPDSILNNESYDIIQDVSHTNSIHKVYVSFMNLNRLNVGDIIVIYRTSDKKGPAKYRSVVTSVCVVEEVKSKYSFKNIDEYLEYCGKYSIFDKAKLSRWYNDKKNVYIVRMTYNAALRKRLTRGKLIDEVGLNKDAYWGCMSITDLEFNDIMEMGEVDESIIFYKATTC